MQNRKISAHDSLFETFKKVFFGHPELVSGSQNMLILLDDETSLP
jgi:hypothetical protein